MSDKEARSVTLFREFIRIRTDHPTPKYGEAIDFLQRIYKEEIGLPCEVIVTDTTLPHQILVVTWEGTEPELPAIMLNSHLDVVPAVPEMWKVDPFEAHKDEHGNIYGRGTQDMKCVCIQYMEAIRKLKASGARFRRTIHLTYVPDEETGGHKGMSIFVRTSKFKTLNVGLCLDEGLASPTEAFTVFYGERTPQWLRLTAKGPTGHGSRFIEGTAVEKLMTSVRSLLDYRKEMHDKLEKGKHECGMKLGDVTTLNLTMLKAGVTTDGGKTYSINVIPMEAEAGFDLRIPPGEYENVLQKVKDWTEGLSEVEYLSEPIPPLVTPITSDNAWWSSFSGALNSIGQSYDTEIFPAATDGRFVRNVGLPVFGFSPINNTPILLHDHNEFLNEKVFIKGIDVYCHIIPQLANL